MTSTATCTEILQHYEIDPAHLRSTLQRYVGELRSGNAGKPDVRLAALRALAGRVGLRVDRARRCEAPLRRAPGRALAMAPSRYLPFELAVLEKIAREDLRKNLADDRASSGEAGSVAPSAKARRPAWRSPGTGGKPRRGGDRARRARRAARPLHDRPHASARRRAGSTRSSAASRRSAASSTSSSRRRKNNPIIVGEAGRRKDGARRGARARDRGGQRPRAAQERPRPRRSISARSRPGAGVKGEFENRLKGVITEVKASPKPIVLFIDEAHTIIGAGGPQGGGDAANLLKPALARGELRTIAATTWAEYKKYFEKDAALERRFQPVKVEEPSIEVATLMIRGLARRFEEAHGVVIQDEAVRAAVTLSSRYISRPPAAGQGGRSPRHRGGAREDRPRGASRASSTTRRAALAGRRARARRRYDRDYAAGISDRRGRQGGARSRSRRSSTADSRCSTKRTTEQRAIVDAHRRPPQGGRRAAREAKRAELTRGARRAEGDQGRGAASSTPTSTRRSSRRSSATGRASPSARW